MKATHPESESDDGLVICWHQNVQIGQRRLQVVFAKPYIVLVLVPHSWLFVENPKLDKDIIEPKVGSDKRGVRVVISAEIDITTFLDEVVHSEERNIATERGWGDFCPS